MCERIQAPHFRTKLHTKSRSVVSITATRYFKAGKFGFNSTTAITMPTTHKTLPFNQHIQSHTSHHHNHTIPTTLTITHTTTTNYDLTILVSKATAKTNCLPISFGINTISNASSNTRFISGKLAIIMFAAL